MQSRLETLRFEMDRLIKQHQPQEERYFLVHLYSVSYFCTLLALRRELDTDIAAACGMLHDLYQITAGTSLDHAAKGAEQAKGLLEALQLYSNEEIGIITAAISRHSDKHLIHGPMDEVLKDADVMAHCLYDAAAPVKEKERQRYQNIRAELGCVI